MNTGDWLMIKTSNDYVASCSNTKPEQEDYRVVQITQSVIDSVSGDTLPEYSKQMVRGHLTASFAYTKPVVLASTKPKFDIMTALDPANESGTTKKMLEFLQERFK